MSVPSVTLPTQVGNVQLDAYAAGTRNKESVASGGIAQAISQAVNRVDEQTLGDQTRRPTSVDELKKAADKLNKVVNVYASELKFIVDEDTGIDVVRVIDTESKEVIRQIPSEEMLKIAESIERLQGLLVRQQA